MPMMRPRSDPQAELRAKGGEGYDYLQERLGS